MKNLGYYIGVWGEAWGLVLIAIVCLWDFVMLGIRHFAEWRIAPAGQVALIIGIVLIVASKHLDKNFK